MDKEKQIQNEIEKTLMSLDNLQKQKAKPFLYTRIQAKMERSEKPSFISALFDVPFLKPAFVGTLILINTITILHLYNINTSAINTKQTSLEIFAEDYAFNQSSDYLFNIENE